MNHHLSHHDIHEIYSQISQSNLNCVECKASILPHNIQITDIVDGECLFDVYCERCNSAMTLSAQVEKTPNQAAMTYNKSSQIVHDGVVDSAVSSIDVHLIKDELRHFCGSFVETFARY